MPSLATLTFSLAPKSPLHLQPLLFYIPQIPVPQTLHSLITGPLHMLSLPLPFSLLYLNQCLFNLIIQVSPQGSLLQGTPLTTLRKSNLFMIGSDSTL